jgi:hypothetical protein
MIFDKKVHRFRVLNKNRKLGRQPPVHWFEVEVNVFGVVFDQSLQELVFVEGDRQVEKGETSLFIEQIQKDFEL